jgi:hypothetical protein
MAAGPHVSALILENTQLIWEDIKYQVKAGFVCMIAASDLFGENQPPDLKISWVAVVPQDNRRGRIILNLSAEVAEKWPRLFLRSYADHPRTCLMHAGMHHQHRYHEAPPA